jgi:hypothetical protein
MSLIAETHLQFIIEVAVIIQVGMIFLLNLIPLSLSFVLLGALILASALAGIFTLDTLLLFIPGFTHHELTHPFGSVALLAIITSFAALPMMREVGINFRNLKIYLVILVIIITVVGGLMHRSFLLLWFLGLFIGFFIISKSFRQKSVFTIKRILLVVLTVGAGFGALEIISRAISMPILSPLLRIMRIEQYAIPSMDIVIKNSSLFGHVQESCFWLGQCLGGADGYISLPISIITMFGLPYPVFYGILVTKKDVIDYMLPGTFGVAFDFGYLTLILVLLWALGVIVIGFKMMAIYRDKREKGEKNYLGREALLLGTLTAFIAQSVIGLFIINRSLNGTALLVLLFLSALVIAHLLMVKKN